MFRSTSFNSPFACSLLAIAALLAAAPARAQTTPPPVPAERITPPLRYSLPPGDGEQQPTPTPTPTVQVAPPPVVVPSPATSSPTPTPSPRPAPSPRAAAAPAVVPEPSAPIVPADEAPAEEASAPAAPVPLPTVSAAAPVSAEPVPEPARNDWTWWMLGAGLLLVAAAAVAVLRQRARVAEAYDEPYEAEEPVDAEPVADVLAPTPPLRAAPAIPPAAPADPPQYITAFQRPAAPVPAPAAAAIPAGTITAFRDRPKPAPAADAGFVTAFRTPPAPAPMLAIELQPVRAGCSEDAGFVEYGFAIINPSDEMVGELLVSAWLLSANAEQDREVLAYLAEPADPSRHNVFALRPGEHKTLDAAMALPFDQLHIVEAANRRFFAPMLLIDARYRSRHGAAGRTSAAFMIGRPQAATGKLSPIFVDRGPRVVEGLAARPYRLPAG